MPEIAHLTDRAVIRVSGPDARPFLQGLLTHDVEKIAPKAALWSGLLTPQGKALFELMLHDGGDGAVLIDVAADRAAALVQRLSMYRLRRDVAIEASPLNVYAAWGPGADAHPADSRLKELGARWLAMDAPAAATLAAYHRHRRTLGVPDAHDIGIDKTLWLETNARELNGISFSKGCFVGQENSARMHHRDKVRRRLLPVRLEGDVGDDMSIRADGREAGELRSHADGVGIAYLRMESVDAGAALTIGDRPVSVIQPSWLAADAPAA